MTRERAPCTKMRACVYVCVKLGNTIYESAGIFLRTRREIEILARRDTTTTTTSNREIPCTKVRGYFYGRER